MADLFFSCRSANLEKVQQLCDRIRKDTNLTIWIDIEQLGAGVKMYSAVQKAIRDSKVFVAFITKDYLRSQNRINELEFANLLNKKCIYVILEGGIDPSPIWYQYILKGVFKYDAFNETGGSGDTYSKFLDAIRAVINN